MTLVELQQLSVQQKAIRHQVYRVEGRTFVGNADRRIVEIFPTVLGEIISITESQITDLGNYTTAADVEAYGYLTDAPSNGNEYVRLNGAWSISSGGGGGATQLSGLSDVNTSTPTNRNVLVADGIDWESRALVEADISDLQTYLTTEANDLTAAVTWANVPDANITESSVTQHQAALTITESQISDLGTYLENLIEDTTPQLGGQLDVQSFGMTGSSYSIVASGTMTLQSTSTMSLISFGVMGLISLGAFTMGGTTTATITGSTGAALSSVTGDVTISTGSGDIVIGDTLAVGQSVNIATSATDGDVNIGNYTFDPTATVGSSQDNYVLSYDHSSGEIGLSENTQALIIAIGDESTPITSGTAKVTFRMPYPFTLTEVRASLTVAGSTSGVTTFDINESGSTILSTKLTIDQGEKTSETAATAAVISDPSLADDAEITIDVDGVSGGATEAGGKITLIGYKS